MASAAVLAVAARVMFWLMTNRVWEDALITLTQVRNVFAGIGLTHHAGEPPVQGFTSALSVLIPLPAEAIAPGSGVTVMRLASLIAAVATIYLANRILRRLDVSLWPRLFAVVFLAIEQNQIFYGMAGMETQIAVSVLLWSMWAVLEDRFAMAGISIGIAVLARPDFLLWAVPAIGLTFLARPARGLGLALVALMVVSPWLLFTTWYYGSPVPQTIIAKATVDATSPASFVDNIGPALRAFMPYFADSHVVGAPVPTLAPIVVALSVVMLTVVGYLATWRAPSWRPALAFFAGFLLYRLAFLPPTYFDWYLPPFTAVGALIAACGLNALTPRLTPQRIVAALLIASFALPFPFMVGLEGRIQSQIEDGTRLPFDLYVGSVVPPGQPVIAESAGYLGYYAHVTLYDVPGLTSRVALDELRRLPTNQRDVAGLANALRTPWLIVRPSDLEELHRDYPDAAAAYRICRTFRSSDAGPRVEWAGYVKATIDTEFTLMHLGPCPSNALE